MGRPCVWSASTSTLLFALLLTACDSVDIAHGEDPAGGPVLVKIMIQDEEYSSGRWLATDILRDPVAYEAKRAAADECSELETCPAGRPPCVIAEGSERGYCPDPLNPAETPPAVGTPVFFGGNQIRLVFDRVVGGESAAAAVKLLGEDGEEVAVEAYFDPSGDPSISSDPILVPYGPAVVLKNLAPLSAGSTYELVLDGAKIFDRRGEPFSGDTSHEFQMEPLYALYAAPDFVADPAMTISPFDYFSIETNAAIDASTAIAIVTSAGERLHAGAFVDCERGDRVLNIVHTSSVTGELEPWPEGQYEIKISAAGDNGETMLDYDAFGTPFAGAFTVSMDAAPSNPDAAQPCTERRGE